MSQVLLSLRELLRDPDVRAPALAFAFWVVGLVVSRLAVGALTRFAGRHLDAQRVQSVRRISFYALVGLVTLAALHRGGVDMSVFFGAAGILTVAFGFASQTSMSNLISGVFLIGERSFEPGDIISVGATVGEVLQVDLPRPRNRVQLAEDPHYAQCRKAVIDFLYTRQAHVEKAA